MKKKILITATALVIFFTPMFTLKPYANENKIINIENAIKGYINAGNVNFRNNPSLESEIYYTLNENDDIEVISEDGNWSKIVHNDKVGYVSNKYISEKNKSTKNDYEVMNVKATAYSGDTITSTGTKPKWGTIAVDPKIIPYGTKVYIPKFDKVFVAEDTGSAIKGNKIDIFMDTEEHCNEWGVKNIEIYVLA